MWALIAFIVMAVVILTLIEINERIKAKRPPSSKDDCERMKADDEACNSCSLHAVCEENDKGKS